MMLDFERLRVVHDFRQPATFHGFTLIYCLIFPILFAPSFAKLAAVYGLVCPFARKSNIQLVGWDLLINFGLGGNDFTLQYQS